MADSQNVVYAQAYSRNIMQLAQQKYSKLINCVYLRPNVNGKTFFQDQIGKWSMEVKAGRNVQTPNNDPSLARRMGTLLDYHDNRLLDRGDELRTISDPRSAYTIAAAQALGRQIDDVIFNALVGTAYSGETGTTSNTVGSGQYSDTSGDLSFARVTTAKRILDDADVETEDRFFVITPSALEDLLNTSQATSADYNSVKALIRGEIDTWMGFKWITSSRCPEPTYTSTFNCIAFQRNALCLAMAAAPLVRTDERQDLSYSWQVYYELNIGAVRLEEEKVVIAEVG